MNRAQWVGLSLLLTVAAGCASSRHEGTLNPFFGKPDLVIRDVFPGERYPNIVCALDGTLLAFMSGVRVKRSVDGGDTWGAEIHVGEGFMGGGVVVNEANGEGFYQIITPTTEWKTITMKLTDLKLNDDKVENRQLDVDFAARPWIWQGAFGVWLVSSFVAAIGAIGFASALSRAGLIVGLGSRAMIALTRLGAEIGTAMKALLRAGEAVAAAFSGPETLVLVLGCALASLMALGALSSLLAAERSTRHVESW